MREKYLRLFREIGNSVDETLSNIFGTDKAKEKFKQGAFGDTTVYVDKIAENIVLRKIDESKLQCSLLSEEIGWVEFGSKLPVIIVDPIDGSLNAKRGLPYFSISVALSENLTTEGITVGYVKNLANKDEFYAVKKYGSFLNNKRIITASQALDVVAVEGFKKSSPPNLIEYVYKNFNKVRQMGSMALDICYLSTGAFDIFLNVIPSRIIDYAASKIILEEAGGGMYNWIDNKPFVSNVSKEIGGQFFALSNRKLLNKFLKMTENLQ